MANKSAIIVGVVVVIIAVAAIAAFALNNNNDKDKTPEIGVGDSMTFEVFGTYGDDGTLIDGTMTIKVLEETDTQYRCEVERSIYTVATDGTKTALTVGKETDWEDKEDDDLVYKGTLTVDTFWGEKKLSCYESEDGTQHALKDGNIIYAAMIEDDEKTLCMELTDCTAIKDKKADREVHEATIVMAGDAVTGGYEFTMTMTYTMDNKETEIFKRTVLKADLALKDYPEASQEIMNGTSWSNPFAEEKNGMVKTGTERISTAWGTKETDVYKKVADEESTTMYAYGDVPVRCIYETTQVTITMDATSITVDGESVTLEEAAEL